MFGRFVKFRRYKIYLQKISSSTASWRELCRSAAALASLSWIVFGAIPPKIEAQQTNAAVDAKEAIAPVAPDNVSGVARSASHIVLTWKDNSNNEAGFKIERKKTNGDGWQFAGRVPTNVTTFESVGLIGETYYDHRVYAYNDFMYSSKATLESVKTLKIADKPRGRVIVAATPDIIRNGEGSFVRKGNDLMFFYSAFAGLGDWDRSRIAVKVSTDKGATWSAQRIVFEDPKISLLLPSVILMSSGEIGLAYSKLFSGTRAVKVFRFSSDGGANWSNEIPLSDNVVNYMTGAHDRLIKLGNNRLLNLVHGKIPGNNAGMNFGTHVFASDDNGRTWVRQTANPLIAPYNPFDKGEYGFWETTAVETSNGNLYMLGRTATGWLYESRSTDYGKTWTQPSQSNLLNPLAPSRLGKIPGTDTLILIRNSYTSMNESWHGGNRFVLSSQISEDAGATWKNYKEIEYDQSTNWYEYPAIFWDGDTLHISYRDITRRRDSWVSVDVRYIALQKSWFTETSPAAAAR